MERGASLRQTASECGIHLTTAFRWRHRFLAWRRDIPLPALDRSIALGSVRVQMTPTGVVSGAHPQLGEPSLLNLHAYGCVGRDRGERFPVLRFTAGFGSVRWMRGSEVDALIGPWIAPGCTLLALGRLDPLARYAHSRGYRWRRDRGRRDPKQALGRRVPDRRLAQAAAGRFRVWIRRFRGIGVTYLENYLEWFRVVTSRAEHEPNPEALRFGPPTVASGVRGLAVGVAR
jgi:hypothetical protein